MRRSEKQKRTDIQALRTIAVLAVVIYHLWPDRLTGGFMGVDVFFVISGYLMTLTLTRHIDPVLGASNKLRATGTYLVEFYARRIKRLVPAASVTLLAVLGMVALTGNYNIIETTSKQVMASATFVQNLYLANESVDYLAASTPPTAVQHFWSLSLEEQFYLVWPLLLLGILLLTFHISVMYKKTHIPGAVIPVTLLTTLLFLYGYVLTQTNPAAAYFVTFARVWELLLGGLLVFLPAIKNYDLKLLLPWLGTAMIGYALYKWDGVGFPGWHALIPTLGTALILYAGATKTDSIFSFTHLLRLRPIQWIGDISYSLYLWHWPLIILLPVLFTVNIEGECSRYIKIALLAVSFILAWLSYKYIELPAQKVRVSKRWVYLAFLVITSALVIIGYTLSQHAKNQATAQLDELHAYATSDKSPCLGARALHDPSRCGRALGLRNEMFAQMNTIDTFTNIISTRKDCTIFHPTPDTKPDPRNMCEVGNLQGDTHITLWGDSHANHWINALDEVGKKNNIKFTILSSGQCAGMDADQDYCRDRIAFIRDSRILDDSDAVLVSIWFRYGSENPIQPTEDALDAVARLTDTPVYLLQDIPPAGLEGGPGCDIRGLSCKTTTADAFSAMRTAYEKAISDHKISRENIIPTDDMFCDEKSCYSFIGGLPVYQSNALKDDPGSPQGNSHMTATYSLTVAPLLADKLFKYGLVKNFQ